MIRRFRALMWKEWRGLQPFYILLVILFLFFLVWTHFIEFVDEKLLWYEFFTAKNFFGIVLACFFLSVVGCLGVLTREKEEGSLLYLDGLPVSRFSVYCVKWLTVFLMVAGIGLAWTLEALIYDFLSRESDSPITPWNHLVTFAALNTFLCAFFISFMFPLSFLRLWSLLALGLLWWATFMLRAYQIPYSEWLDPFSLIDPPTSIEDSWKLPWGHISTLAVVGAISWLIGLFIFSRKDGSTKRGFQKFVESTGGKVAFVSISVAAVLGAMFYAASQSNPEDFEELPPEKLSGTDIRPAAKQGNEIAYSSTAKYDFIYRKRMRKRMKPLVEEADDIYTEVAAFLDAEKKDTSGRTTVDLTNPLGAHNAGQAYWKKIRMAYPKNISHEEAKAVLAHETTHVLIDRITGGRLEESFESARWFHEGLASYVEFERFREPGAAKGYETWLALASTWGEVHFNELVQNSILSLRRDTFLVYPAGLEWVRAAVDVYGEDCPAKLLKAIGRRDAPRKLEGLAFWRDACLAAGYDLERIRTRFRARLKSLREKYREDCEALPEIEKATVKRRDGRIIVEPELPEGWKEKAPKGARLVCRLRPAADSPPGEWRFCELNKNEVFEHSALSFLKQKVGYQVGWRIEKWAEHAVFSQWVEAKVE